MYCSPGLFFCVARSDSGTSVPAAVRICHVRKIFGALALGLGVAACELSIADLRSVNLRWCCVSARSAAAYTSDARRVDIETQIGREIRDQD